ncbi:hypothetical protein [Yersinia proxima]|uniref:hypothetical protein n=1 Tax=Yersinia proxima TaxID=2890316 RepID=UPI003D692E0F
MNNFEELKKAALGANLHGWTGFEDALNDDGYSEAVSKFIGHCRPSEILALIAQLESAQKELSDLKFADYKLWHGAACNNHQKVLRLEAALSAANERLSKPVVEEMEYCEWPNIDHDDSYVNGWNDCVSKIKAAGFTVEGE